MNQTSNKVKNIVVAVLAIFLAYKMCDAAISMGTDVNLQKGFGGPLTLAMQAVSWISVVVLCTMAFQNLLEFYVLWKYSGKTEINEKARKLIRFTIYAKIYASLALRLVFSILFTVLACVAFFAPGVQGRGGRVYGAGVFMLALAAFMAYSNIRVAIARVRELRGDKNETEDV